MNNNYFYPEDIEHRNAIDRLANFVAKNGDEFELMTKQKQQGNSMFEFLFGGAYSDYYQYRLSEERRKMDNENHMNHNSEFLENKSYTPSSNQYSHGFDFTQTDYFQNYNVIEEMDKRLSSLKMSLADLQSAHYGKLNESQQNLTSESISINQEKMRRCLTTVNINRLNKIKESCKDYNINFETMESIIQALITSCTKDNICNGKNFVIENMTKDNKTTQFICEYLLANVSKSSQFNDRLHIIYFLNDLLHYCKRKSVPILLNAIESVIVLIYSMSVLLADEDGKNKLNKVLSLWESNSYVKSEILNSMKLVNDNPKPHVDEWLDRETTIIKREEDEVTVVNSLIPVEESISRILSDAKMKLSNLEANHNQLKYELKIEEENLQLEIYQLEREIKMAEVEVRKAPREPIQREYQDYQETDYPLQLMQNYDMSFQMPDITRPPPGFAICEMPGLTPEPQFVPPITQQLEVEMRPERPSIPYWRLPAAVMVAHVKLAQFDYEPIDANAIQLPQLKPPSKRLIDITNTFYQPPSHERPRDTEGWEKSALHEFYKAKEMAKSGEQPNDFISCLHEKHNEDDYHESIQGNERLMDTDYRHMDISDLNDFRSVPDLNCSNPDYSFHHHAPQFGMSPNCSPRVSSQRSLLGSPWEEYRHHPFNNPDMPLMRNMNYNNSSNRVAPSLLGTPSRHMQPKVTPLMSLDVSNSFKRQSNPRNKRDSYSRNVDNMPYNNRNKNRRRYLSRSRSPYNRSVSRSRSRSSRYSRSRSRTYSRSRSFSRSRSQSSRSSRSSDKLPYKGGFIARKSRSRSYSRSRSLSRSPRSEYETPHNQYNKVRNEDFEEVTEPVLRNEHYPEVDRYTNEDVFSRFRLRKSVGYSEWMKERTERRIGVPEELPESY